MASDTAEAMPGGDAFYAGVEHGDIIPVSKVLANTLGADGVVGGQVVQCLVRQYHSPAEGIVGPVALEDDDLMRGVAQLHADGEVEASGSTAETGDFHYSLQSCPSIELRLGRLVKKFKHKNFKHEVYFLRDSPGTTKRLFR